MPTVMRRLLSFCILAATAGAQERFVPSPEQKHAFVVGLSDYGDEKRNLPNVAKDLAILTGGLPKVQFNVKTLPARQTITDLVNGLDTWLRQRKESDFLLLYFSGHGFQSNGNLYLAPSNFDPNNVSPLTLDHNALSAAQVLSWLKSPSIKYSHALVVFDMCQTDFIKGEDGEAWTPSLGEHVQRIAVFLPSQGGKATTDNPSQDRGILAQPLLDQLSKENVTLENALSAVKEQIKKATAQVPVVTFELSPTIFLNGTPKTDDCTLESLNKLRTSGTNADERVRLMQLCFAEPAPKPDDSLKFSSTTQILPWGFTKEGRVGLNSLALLKEQADWSNTTGVAREWWEAFEVQNVDNPEAVALLLGELTIRNASITEFFLAYVYSDVDSVQANLDYLDKMRADKAAEGGKLYLPPPHPDQSFVTATSLAGLPQSARRMVGRWDGDELLGRDVPWGGPESILRPWWQRASANFTPQQRTWLLFEARAMGLSVTNLRSAAGTGALSPSREFLEAASRAKRNDPLSARLDAIGELCLYCEHPASTQDMEAAVRELDGYIASSGDFGRLYVTRGRLLEYLGRYRQAYLSYQEGLAQGFDNGPTRNNMAAYLLRVGDHQEAMRHFQRAHEIEKTAMENAKKAENRSSYIDAVASLTMYLLNAAEVSLHDENYKDAVRFLDEAVTVDKAMADHLPEWELQEAELASVKEYLDGWAAANAIIRSAVFAAQGRVKEAEDVFTKAKLDVSRITAYEYRCWANAFLGDAQMGLDDCGRVIAKQPFNLVDGYAYQAMALFRLKRYPEALQSIDEALKIIPESGHYHFERALIEAGLKKFDDAEDELEQARWLGYKVPNLKWVNQALQVAPEFSLWMRPTLAEPTEYPLAEVLKGNARGEAWARGRFKELLKEDDEDNTIAGAFPQSASDREIAKGFGTGKNWRDKLDETVRSATTPDGIYRLLLYWEQGASHLPSLEEQSHFVGNWKPVDPDKEALLVLKNRAREIASLDPAPIRAYSYRLALRLVKKQQMDGARDAYSAGWKFIYGDSAAPVSLCNLDLHLHMVKESLEICAAAAKQDAEDFVVARMLGHAYLLNGQRAEAMKQYRFRPAKITEEAWDAGAILREIRELNSFGPIPNLDQIEAEVRMAIEFPAGRSQLEKEKADVSWGTAAKLTREWWLEIEKLYFYRLGDLALAVHDLNSEHKSLDSAFLTFLSSGDDPLELWEEKKTEKPNSTQDSAF